MGFYDKIALFVDTNLGTRFALSISQDISVRDLKDKLGMEHFSCFPYLGKVKVHGLMVKKKSFFYHLSDSMATKYVFEGVSKTWFLHLNASWVQDLPYDISSVPRALHPTSPSPVKPPLSIISSHVNHNQKTVTLNAAEHKRSSSITNDVAECLLPDDNPTRDNVRSAGSSRQAKTHPLNSSSRKKVKDRNINKHHNPPYANGEVQSTSDLGFCIEHQPIHFNNIDEGGKLELNEKSTLSDHPFDGKENENYMEKSSMSNQTISVTGIISRFFSGLDEVDSYCCQPKLLRECEKVHDNELIDSQVRDLATEPDHTNSRRTVESDTDTRCSFASLVEDNTAEREEVAWKVKSKQIRPRKLVHRRSSQGTPHISSSIYKETPNIKECKHQVGRRLVQAANSIMTSGSGNTSATMILSRCRNLATPDSALLVRSVAFDTGDFVD